MAISTPSYKVILIGEYGVGKSSLFRRFMDNSFTELTGQTSTLGLDSFTKEYTFAGDKIKVRLHIYVMSSMSIAYLALQMCFVIVFDATFVLSGQHMFDVFL